MTGPSISDKTAARLDALFGETDRARAARLLEERCGNNVPLCENYDSVAMERIRFAALKVSDGDLIELEKAVDLACIDWRDLLVSAGFAHDVQAHASWFPVGLQGRSPSDSENNPS